ncbi:MAG: DUF4105 domain-containing protein [Verrucomicrobiota bacterium]
MTEEEKNEHNQARLRPACLGGIAILLVAVVAAVLSLWAFGAIYYDGPIGRGTGNLVLGLAWAVVMLVLVFRAKTLAKRFLVWLACFALVWASWLYIPASNDRDWQQEWSRTAWAEVGDDGDTITIHNFRNFDYARDGSVTERWETRTVRLSNLQGIDLFLDAFGGENWAHPMLSYDFGPDGRVLISIETRREKSEKFSQIGGLYKMFELQYLIGEERDFVRVRTNIRNEPMYLYSGRFQPERGRETFLATVRELNSLKETPKYYNVITHNCTTSYRAQRPPEERHKWDIRILINGKLDELLYERGAFITEGLSFPELRKQAMINETAMDAHHDPEFSERIREGLVGF